MNDRFGRWERRSRVATGLGVFGPGLLWAVLAGGALAGWTGCTKQESKAPAAVPPVPVIAAEVLVRNQPLMVENIGQTRGSKEIQIQARVEGFLESIHFVEGRPVSAGELLYTIDPRPFEASLNQARGQLASAEAAWTRARQDLERFKPLIERNAISRQQYDNAVATERASFAGVETARASAQSAEIQLGYTRVTAPAAGLAGKSEVSVGNLVGRGQTTLLTTISTIDPIHVRFSVSEKDYLEWRRQYPGPDEGRKQAENIFELILSDGTTHSHRGSPVFADRLIDPATGTLMLEAAFANPERLVRPGQYARVRYATQVQTNAVLVPQRAIQELQATFSVVVVKADRTAEFRPVTPGARVGGFRVIESGLRPGETIVVEGLQKLRPGSSLAVSSTNLVLQTDGLLRSR